MASKNWLKQANTPRPGADIENEKTLRWQAPITKYPGAKATTRQRMIQNTTFIFPAGGTRAVKRP